VRSFRLRLLVKYSSHTFDAVRREAEATGAVADKDHKPEGLFQARRKKRAAALLWYVRTSVYPQFAADLQLFCSWFAASLKIIKVHFC
jgi:hypothetical protein